MSDMPYDRFRKVASFLCGYFKISEERAEELAKIIRDDCHTGKPYEISHCQKCDSEIEIEFWEGDDEECSEPHYYCPKCYANYFDKKAQEPWHELDAHYEELEERRRERDLEDWKDADWY